MSSRALGIFIDAFRWLEIPSINYYLDGRFGANMEGFVWQMYSYMFWEKNVCIRDGVSDGTVSVNIFWRRYGEDIFRIVFLLSCKFLTGLFFSYSGGLSSDTMGSLVIMRHRLWPRHYVTNQNNTITTPKRWTPLSQFGAKTWLSSL